MRHNNTPIHKSIKLGHRFLGGALLISAVAVSACAPAPESTLTPSEQENASVEDVTENTESLIGETVSIRGEVNEVIGDAAFLMQDEGWFNGEDVLVINVSGEGLTLPEGDDSEVQATGEVRELNIADLESEYGVTLDPDLFADYENQPVVVADNLALAPDPDELTSDPEQYYGQRIAVQGEVEEVFDNNTFSIDDETLFGADDLLVINTGTADQMQADQAVQEDETVTVTGVLQPFIAADFERDYDLNWDASVTQQIEAEYEQKPVFLVDNIYPSAVDK